MREPSRWWPIAAFVLFLSLGTLAFVVGGFEIDDVIDRQNRDEQQDEKIDSLVQGNAALIQDNAIQTEETQRSLCAAARVVEAGTPLQFVDETAKEFERYVRAGRFFQQTLADIDCDVVLARLRREQRAETGGGDAQSPQTGSQLVGLDRGDPGRSRNRNGSEGP